MRRAAVGIALLTVATTIGLARDQDAATILATMRAALGGEAALDAVKTLSVSGSLMSTLGGRSKTFSVEWLTILPDHFMTVRRDSQVTGPMAVDITYYDGFRGGDLIRWTQSNIAFPPDPGPLTPAAIAQRRADSLLRHRREFARLHLILFGTAPASYSLQFAYAGRETVDGRPVAVIDCKAADDFAMRLLVDTATHLPAAVSWQQPEPVVLTTTTTSQVTMRGGQVVSQAPPVAGAPAPDPASVTRPLLTWRAVPSDFKVQNGLNWPRRLQVFADREMKEEMRLRSYRVNPRIDPSRFDVGDKK